MRLILRGHMIDIREVARFPALHAVVASPTHIMIQDLPPSHIRIVREALEAAADCINSNRESFFHRHQGTWLMLRSCARSGLHLLAMAMQCRWEADLGKIHREDLERAVLPPTWRELIHELSSILEYWSDESNDLNSLNNIFRGLMGVYEGSIES
jgi:hypothetical protein